MYRLFPSVLIGILMVAACSASSGAPTTTPSIAPDAVRVAAKDLAFSTDRLSAPADKRFQIAFDNQEGVPHNVAIYRDASAGEKVFGSGPFTGPALVAYEVPALPAGTYYFRCDVHPDMAGELTAG